MALTQGLRYLNNEDSSSIGYKRFNDRPADNYPTFSICLLSVSRSLQEIFNSDLMETVGINAKEYNELLKGNDVFRRLWGTKLGFLNISNINQGRFTHKLESIFRGFRFDTEENDSANVEVINKTDNESWPFYLSYSDPDTICFTRKSMSEPDLIRTQDLVWFEYDYLKNSAAYFHVYMHHPGQLIRSLGTPVFKAVPFVEINPSNSKISLMLNQVSTLRKRPDAKKPCDSALKDDDTRFLLKIIKRVGCVPSYWKAIMPMEDSMRFCAKSKEMADIFHAIKNKKEILASYDQPCDYMKVSIGVLQQRYSSGLFMNLIYKEQDYQEVTNTRDFGFESFWSGVGGFLGIFIGYSLLELPETIKNLWIWLKRSKKV